MNEQIINEVRSLAMEKYANEEQAEAFVQGFFKEAALSPSLLTNFGAAFKGLAGNEMVMKAGVGLAAGLAGAAIVKGISSATSGVENLQLRSKYESSLAHALNNSRTVKGGKPEKVRSFGETIFRFAPHVASDPHLLTTLLEAAVLSDGLDPTTVKGLVDLENKYKDNTKASPLLGIRV